jgi:hypothetical protein
MSYITSATLKANLTITVTDDDTLLTSAITEAQATIDHFCKRTFEAAADTTRYFDPLKDSDDFRQLFFDEDCCAITTVVNGDGVTISPSDYVTNPRNYKPYYSLQLKITAPTYLGYNTAPENAVAVTGRWAYSVTAPADIQHACLRLAMWYYRQRDTSADGDRPILTTSGAVIMPSKLPADVTDILSRYERRLP